MSSVTNSKKCFFCERDTLIFDVAQEHNGYFYNCPFCGKYIIEEEAEKLFRDRFEKKRHLVAGYLHSIADESIKTPIINGDNCTDYFDNGAIVSVTNYEHNRENFQITQSTTTDSQNNVIEQRTKYPTDYNDVVSTGMVNKHIINTPIEQLTLKNDQIVSARKTQYTDTLGMYLPKVQSQVHAVTPLVQNSYESAYKPVLFYDKYTSQGKIRQLRGADNMPVTYLWSYSGQYPIAEIKNATYEQVKSVLGGESAINALADNGNPSDADIQAAGDNLRNALPQAMVSTYTYKPLVGMTSVTDPRGIKTTYVYDEFQRLKNVLDYQGSKLQEYKYHYQNQ